MRDCKGLCKKEYLYGIKIFSKKRLPYNKASWCSKCEVSVRPPSVDKIIVTRKIREEFIDKIKVECPCCGTVCRGGPLSKNKKNGKDKQRARQENTLPDSVKINLIEDTIRRLKVQAEYENDPSLRLDDPEAKHAGTLASMIRPYVQTTLEELERLRNEIIQPKNESKKQSYISEQLRLRRQIQLDNESKKQQRQQHISKEQQEVINRRNEAQARILYLKVKREIKQLEQKLGREIQFVPIVDIIEEEEEDKDDGGAETEGKESNIDN